MSGEQRAARRLWARLTPRRRAARLARAERETEVINARLDARGRDDSGFWEPALHPLPDFAIHASVLPTGKVLIFGRERLRADRTRFNLGSARVFDPATGRTRHVPPPEIPENPGSDGDGDGELPAAIYCAGQALLSDGRVLLAGGNLAGPDVTGDEFAGLSRTFLFDPWTETWATGPNMSNGRWYPTLTKLPSGDVIIAGGYDEDGHGVINPRMEIYRPNGSVGTLQVLPAGERGPATNLDLPAIARVDLSLYPNMFVLPTANVVLAGPGRADSALLDPVIAQDVLAPRGSAWVDAPMPVASREHYGGSPALEPDIGDFDGTWNVVNLGGADSNGQGFHLARRTVDRLVAGPGAPDWTIAPALNRARFYLNAVLLPDGGMVAVGGGTGTDNGTLMSRGNYYLGPNPSPQLKQVELRRPGQDTWRLGAAQQEWRTYHSTAALLPDGRVMSAGDDGHEGPDPDLTLPDSQRRDSAEMYWPPYLFDGDICALRPEIRSVASPAAPPSSGAWATLGYGATFGIFSEHAQPGMRAVLVAPAAVTHSVDMNQRLVPLQVQATIAGGGLNVTAPAAPAIAPPGFYMLFVVDAAGTPSVARWVRLAPGAGAAQPVTGPRSGPKGRRCVDLDRTVRSEPDPPEPPQPQPQPPQPQPQPQPRPRPQPEQPQAIAPAAKRSSKLALDRATIDRARRRLDVSAQISALATGRVRFALLAAGRRTRLTAQISPGQRRIRLNGAIPAAQAGLGTGILTMSYAGDGGTRPLSVRLRAAPNAAGLRPARPSYGGAGLLRAAGAISPRARGVVRVELQFEHAGRIESVARSARIANGRWSLRSTLPAAVRSLIAARSGSLDAYVLFTGDQGRRMRGEMRSYQILGQP